MASIPAKCATTRRAVARILHFGNVGKLRAKAQKRFLAISVVTATGYTHGLFIFFTDRKEALCLRPARVYGGRYQNFPTSSADPEPTAPSTRMILLPALRIPHELEA